MLSVIMHCSTNTPSNKISNFKPICIILDWAQKMFLLVFAMLPDEYHRVIPEIQGRCSETLLSLGTDVKVEEPEQLMTTADRTSNPAYISVG
jgi:hypothetical protein